MGKTKISWTSETWNPLVGCSKISAGCSRCYAAEAAKSARLQQFPQYQKVKDWDGTIEFVENQLLKPLSWRSPKKVFVCSMSDIGHKNVKDEWLNKIFAVMAMCPQHIFQVLTKRPERLLEYFSDPNCARWICDEVLNILSDEANPGKWKFKVHGDEVNIKIPLPNVWVGTSVENQKVADDRIPQLLQIPAAKLFLSCEPLLEAVDLTKIYRISNLTQTELTWLDYLHWIILGGESGVGARPCHIDWIRSIVQQCRPTNVAVFVKQLGSNSIQSTPYIDGVAQNNFQLKFKDRKGGNIDEFPTDLQIRQFPE
ncbi:phage Gp37/Gp68 family protein [filamentous cyanobacterium Phorm 6]|nr:phage Gp37/Gp68 family protein [filamentous cyanobacterium Phorm 6]